MPYNKVSMQLLKKLSILSSTIIGAAALTAPVILSSCSSNEKDYLEIQLMQKDIVAKEEDCSKNGSIHLCSETKCDAETLDYNFPKHYSMNDDVLVDEYEIIGEVNPFSEYVKITPYSDILITPKKSCISIGFTLVKEQSNSLSFCYKLNFKIKNLTVNSQKVHEILVKLPPI